MKTVTTTLLLLVGMIGWSQDNTSEKFDVCLIYRNDIDPETGIAYRKCTPYSIFKGEIEVNIFPMDTVLLGIFTFKNQYESDAYNISISSYDVLDPNKKLYSGIFYKVVEGKAVFEDTFEMVIEHFPDQHNTVMTLRTHWIEVDQGITPTVTKIYY